MELKTITTSRLTTAYRVHGTPGARKLLLIHGNASSSAFYEPLMERLADEFYMVAPDLRCFGGSDALPVDATRGMRDFSDDIHELVEALGWDKFSILGWSLGGGMAMQYAIDHSERLEAVVLQAPLSPYGFGGTYDADGKKLEPLGLASGAGCANAQLVAALQSGDRAFIGSVIDTIYVTPTYQIEPALREKFIDSVLTTRVGEGFYPGNSTTCGSWPFVVAGDRGICNTMAPNWCDLSGRPSSGYAASRISWSPTPAPATWPSSARPASCPATPARKSARPSPCSARPASCSTGTAPTAAAITRRSSPAATAACSTMRMNSSTSFAISSEIQ